MVYKRLVAIEPVDDFHEAVAAQAGRHADGPELTWADMHKNFPRFPNLRKAGRWD